MACSFTTPRVLPTSSAVVSSTGSVSLLGLLLLSLGGLLLGRFAPAG